MGESMKFTDLDQYLFGQGTNYEVYKKLGAHPMKCLFREPRLDSYINALS